MRIFAAMLSTLACGGVLIPDGTRHCYVIERAGQIRMTAKRLLIELDHIIPISLGGREDGPTHPVHAYCQRVQGGKCGRWAQVNTFTPEQQSEMARNGGRSVTGEPRVRAGRAGAAALTTEQRVRGGRAISSEQHRSNVRTANHNRWHVNRGIINQECGLC